MSRQVWKFSLRDPEIRMPSCSDIVHVGPDGDGALCIWAEVETTTRSDVVDRRVTIFGTGHDIPDGAKHLHTWRDGNFIWHLYELH